MTENPFTDNDFFKAGGSGDSGCVEVAITDRVPGRVGLRDSKNPHGVVLLLSPAAWVEFTRHVITED